MSFAREVIEGLNSIEEVAKKKVKKAVAHAAVEKHAGKHLKKIKEGLDKFEGDEIGEEDLHKVCSECGCMDTTGKIVSECFSKDEAINSLEGSAKCSAAQVKDAALKLAGKDVANLIGDALGKSSGITRSDIRAACQTAGCSSHATGIIGEIFRTNEAAESVKIDKDIFDKCHKVSKLSEQERIKLWREWYGKKGFEFDKESNLLKKDGKLWAIDWNSQSLMVKE